MRRKWHKGAAITLAAAMLCAQGAPVSVLAEENVQADETVTPDAETAKTDAEATENGSTAQDAAETEGMDVETSEADETVPEERTERTQATAASPATGANTLQTPAANSGNTVEYLTLQPGETSTSVNLNWYAPDGTEKAQVKFGGMTVDATVRELTTPTKVDGNKYTDTGKMVCEATVTGLAAGTEYTYQISYDNGQTWSEAHTYTTPAADSFKFGFTSDPQIKEDQSHDDQGWNSSDGTNQTGWATMMEKLASEGVSLVVSAGDQVEDQSWGKSSEYAAFFAPEEMSSIAYAPAVGNHDRHYMFEDHFNLPNEMSVAGVDEHGALAQVKTTFRGQTNGTSQSHGNYIQATADEIANGSESNGVTPNAEGQYDFAERREMETKGNYYYLYDNVLFVTLNTGAYPGGNDEENAGNASVPSAA